MAARKEVLGKMKGSHVDPWHSELERMMRYKASDLNEIVERLSKSLRVKEEQESPIGESISKNKENQMCGVLMSNNKQKASPAKTVQVTLGNFKDNNSYLKSPVSHPLI